MSNLGGYQIITTISKKVGGPGNFVALTMGCGYIILRGAEAASKKGIKVLKKQYQKKKSLSNDTKLVYEVTSNGKDKDGLNLCVGDKYRILESDKDAVLIEKLGDQNNPYFVSADFLRIVSNFV